MSFNPANYSTGPAAAQAPAAQVATTVTAQALREAGARWLKRHDQFADGKADTCFDMADKLDHFGSFVSDKQAGYAAKLIEWSQPRQYSAQIEATVRPPQASMPDTTRPVAIQTLPKLLALMQRLSKFRIGKLTIARKNGDSLCWIKHEDAEKVVGRLTEHGLTLWQRLDVDLQDVTRALLEIEADPEAAAVLHGKASGNCSICGRDLTDPESIERGIGPICAGKYFS